jgi:hypothetical protein
MSSLDAMLAQYSKVSKGSSSSANSGFDLKNYFTTYLPDGTNSLRKRVRIVPTNGESPFKEVMAHKAQIDGQWKTLFCPKHEDNEKCAFCEAREALLASGTEADKELAKGYGSRRVYVVKVIDRDDEDHGIKFWRFNHDYRNTGTLDKIMGIIQSVGHDISDVETGRDLTININRDQNGRPQIASIVQDDKTPLSDDAEKAKAWAEDERTWRDVYSVKSYDYLKIVVRGGVPTWDKENEKYIDKNAVSSETTEAPAEDKGSELTVGESVETPAPTNTETPSSAPEASGEKADDLPF